MPDDVKVAALNTSGGLAVYGITLNDWIGILTAIYLLAQLGLLVPRYWERMPLRWRQRADQVLSRIFRRGGPT
jgi:hypothetical protein